MGIGVSVFLIAAGAILAFAVDVQNSSGIDLNAVGAILMIVGALGLFATLIVFGPRDRRTEIVEGEPVARTRTVYRERI